MEVGDVATGSAVEAVRLLLAGFVDELRGRDWKRETNVNSHTLAVQSCVESILPSSV